MFDLDDILFSLEVISVSGNPVKRKFKSASIDSRKIMQDEMFFAIKGEIRDGHDYIADAISSGATGVVISRDVGQIPHNIIAIKVKDTFEALLKLAKYMRNKYNPNVISITGSAGKTTTKEILAFILEKYYQIHKSEASFNNHYGVPLTILGLNEKHEYLVNEIGANHIGEIKSLSEIAQPNIGVITNVGYAHIGQFGCLDNTLIAKTEIMDNICKDGTIIINGDDELLNNKVTEKNSNKGFCIITVGNDNRNTFSFSDIECTANGTIGNVIYQNTIYPLKINLIGEHNVYCALFAIAISNHCNINVEKSIEILKEFKSPKGRMNLEGISTNLKIIDDSYNASPDAMIMGVRSLKYFKCSRRIAILGEMKELGMYSEMCHKMVGSEILPHITDLIVTGNDAKFIVDESIAGGFNKECAHYAISATDALFKVKEIINRQSSDEDIIIFVKGSRFTHMERIILGLKGNTIVCELGICNKYINCKNCLESGCKN